MSTRTFFALSLTILSLGLIAVSGCQPGTNLIGDLVPTPTPTPTATGGSADPEASPTPSAEPTQSPAPTPVPLSLLVTIAGNGVAGSSEGSMNAAAFRFPKGLALMSDGSLLVADQGNHRIRKVSTSGVVSTFAGSGTQGFLDAAAASAQFSQPSGIAVAPDGTVYVADEYNHRIRKIDTNGQVSTLAGKGTAGNTDGASTQAEFNFPAGLTVDASGNVYVADTSNHRIRKITPEGGVSTLAGGVSGFADGDALTEARFLNPSGVAIDASGVVFVVDRSNHRIRRIAPDGTVSTVAGIGAGSFGDGSGGAVAFNFPWGIVVGADGHLYVSDGENQRIRRIAPEGTVSTIAGNGTYGLASGMGYSPLTALTTAFRYPAGLAMSSEGVLYIVDMSNNLIRKLY